MKVAFTSQDQAWVNAHFGWAQYIVVYDVDTESATLDRVYDFGAALEADGQGDKLTPKIEAIADCAILYLNAIGGGAAAKVVAKGVLPVKLRDPEPIADLLDKLQNVLRGTPPPWLRKALNKGRSPSYSFED